MADGFVELTPEKIKTPEGLAELNRMLEFLFTNVGGDGITRRVYSGSGSPESAVSADIGSIYLRSDGGQGTTLYIKESGTGATGWVAAKQCHDLKVDTTQTGNVGAGEDNLISYSVPASTLAANGDYLEIIAFGTFAANANSKRLKLYYGSTVLIDSGAQNQNGGSWEMRGTVIRTAAATQKASAIFVSATTLFTDDASYTAPTETLSGAVTVKCTGEGVADNDIVQQGLIVRLHKAP